ncbi:hypothetical protein [Streptomyces sp. NPDC048584]|uniref:hypothetical protein n=1 Tax=Streptomyces sp. NPDC048584 TaxID=3365573 RepID=UPI003723B750
MDTNARTIPTPAAALAPREPFDRTAFERALLGSQLRRDLRLVGLILAHHADPVGHLPADGPQRVDSLCALARIDGKRIRVILRELELSGFMRRPNLHTWRDRLAARPIHLTIPAVTAAARTEPEHPSEAAR